MELAKSPKGRQLAEQAKQQLQKPENRRRLDQLRERIQGRQLFVVEGAVGSGW